MEDRDHFFFKCSFTNIIWKFIMALCLVSDVLDDWNFLDFLGDPKSQRKELSRFSLQSRLVGSGIRFITYGFKGTL